MEEHGRGMRDLLQVLKGIDAPSEQCENSDVMTGDEVATDVRRDVVDDELLSGVSDDDASDCDS